MLGVGSAGKLVAVGIALGSPGSNPEVIGLGVGSPAGKLVIAGFAVGSPAGKLVIVGLAMGSPASVNLRLSGQHWSRLRTDLVLILCVVDQCLSHNVDATGAHGTVVHGDPGVRHCHVGVPGALGGPGVVGVLEAGAGGEAARAGAPLHGAQVRVGLRRGEQHLQWGALLHDVIQVLLHLCAGLLLGVEGDVGVLRLQQGGLGAGRGASVERPQLLHQPMIVGRLVPNPHASRTLLLLPGRFLLPPRSLYGPGSGGLRGQRWGGQLGAQAELREDLQRRRTLPRGEECWRQPQTAVSVA